MRRFTVLMAVVALASSSLGVDAGWRHMRLRSHGCAAPSCAVGCSSPEVAPAFYGPNCSAPLGFHRAFGRSCAGWSCSGPSCAGVSCAGLPGCAGWSWSCSAPATGEVCSAPVSSCACSHPVYFSAPACSGCSGCACSSPTCGSCACSGCAAAHYPITTGTPSCFGPPPGMGDPWTGYSHPTLIPQHFTQVQPVMPPAAPPAEGVVW